MGGFEIGGAESGKDFIGGSLFSQTSVLIFSFDFEAILLASGMQGARFMLPVDHIEKRIYLLRNKKVMLDRDLAILYGVMTGNLNTAVKRNLDRFPSDFMFQLSKEETDLILQNATSKQGGTRKLPYAFTENGIAMLSSVLRSKKAIHVNIQIMRTFTSLRELLSNEDLRKRIELLEKKYQEMGYNVQAVFKAFEEIKNLLNPPAPKSKKIGFIP